MSVGPSEFLCTCTTRRHACEPPCPVHPERGGGLGNLGTLDAIFGYRACGWPGCRMPKGHKGRCAPQHDPFAPQTYTKDQADFIEAAVRERTELPGEPLPLDLPGGPAPRTVPADPQAAEDEHAVRAKMERLRQEHRERLEVRIARAKRMEEQTHFEYAALMLVDRVEKHLREVLGIDLARQHAQAALGVPVDEV